MPRCTVHSTLFLLVSGDANFAMKCTGLTLGGFIQPSVARALIEQLPNIEKGLCQRFLWIVPEPKVVPFDQLQKVNIGFTSAISKLKCIHTIWPVIFKGKCFCVFTLSYSHYTCVNKLLCSLLIMHDYSYGNLQVKDWCIDVIGYCVGFIVL